MTLAKMPIPGPMGLATDSDDVELQVILREEHRRGIRPPSPCVDAPGDEGVSVAEDPGDPRRGYLPSNFCGSLTEIFCVTHEPRDTTARLDGSPRVSKPDA
jgi:hypothetical protein